MEAVDVLPAPDIQGLSADAGPWERERLAFVQLLSSLLTTHAGRYVAVQGGAVVASGSDRIAVTLDAYRRVGYVPLYVGFVGEDRPRRIRVPSPRVLRRAT